MPIIFQRLNQTVSTKTDIKVIPFEKRGSHRGGFVISIEDKIYGPIWPNQTDFNKVNQWLQNSLDNVVNDCFSDNKRLKELNKFLAEKNIDYRLENLRLKNESEITDEHRSGNSL